jgi:D-lactate dehydrogenase (cytochrome)
MNYLKAEHGEALAVRRVLKRALDPDHLINPGKRLPPE